MATKATPKWLHRFSICVYPEGTSLTVQSRDSSTLAPILGRYVPTAAGATEEGVWYEVESGWQRERALRSQTIGSRAMRSIYREWIMQDINAAEGGVALRENLILAFEARRGGNLDTCARMFSKHLSVLIRLGLVVRTMLPNGKATYRMITHKRPKSS